MTLGDLVADRSAAFEDRVADRDLLERIFGALDEPAAGALAAKAGENGSLGAYAQREGITRQGAHVRAARARSMAIAVRGVA